MKKFTLTLATFGSPPATAKVEVTATTLSKAVDKALDLDFEDLDWTDDRGNEVDWDDLVVDSVAVADLDVD